MYEVCKNVIISQRFELTDMLRKIDTLWLQGQISDTQKSELEDLARKHADPSLSDTLLHRVEVLEDEVKKLKSGSGNTEPVDEWPEFQVHHRYKTGDKVTFRGKHYICDLPAHTDVTTWSPADYPGYWKAV